MPYATRDGLRLYYEQAGSGEPPFVFVHGWCCDHTFFEPQYEHFGASSSVTTYDLRGCGTSDRPEDGYEVETLANDLEWLCVDLGITNPVIVGHSLGGLIGIELGARSFPKAVVAVDPGPIDLLPESRIALEALAETLERPDGIDPREAYVAGLFRPTDDLDRARRIADVMCAVPAVTAARILRGYLAWDGVETLRRCDVPVLVVLGSTGTGTSNDPSRLVPIKPDIEIGVTVGAGHFNHLDAAGQVNAMIESFVRVAT